jgi:hypothetical protein
MDEFLHLFGQRRLVKLELEIENSLGYVKIPPA